jgi:hypothetical protein
LIISYHFPPSANVASLRMRGLARYLPAHGWEPVFLTGGPTEPSLDEGRAVRARDPGPTSTLLKSWLGLDTRRSFQEQFGVPAALRERKRPGTRKLFMYVKGWLVFPDEHLFWGRQAVREGVRLLARARFHALASSSPPPTVHSVARALKARRRRLPWIADFRDLWTQGNLNEFDPVRRFFEARFERRTLATADALVCVSEPHAARIATLHPGREAVAIPNGFDPRDYMGLPEAPDARELAIVHTGSLYQGRSDPAPLLAAVRSLLDRGVLDPRTFRLRFYGEPEPWLDGELARLRLEGVARQGGRLPREEALRRQAAAQALLVIVWHDPRDTGIYSAKVFEYLGARRPILAIGGPERSVVRDLLERTRAGDYCRDRHELEAVLARYTREHAATGRLAYDPQPDEVGAFTHDAMARRFAELLDRVAARREPC